jgi:hypothetical protein
MSLDMSTFSAALKQHYTDHMIKNMVYANNPLLALMPKYEKFGGLNLPVPLIYGNPQGRSASFSNALANKTNSQIKAFTLTRVQDYSLANISNEVIEASQGSADAFMQAATTEIDGAIHALKRSMAIAMFRSGTGSIGQISSGSNVGTATITLANISDIVNFEVGMTLQLAATDGATPRTGTVVVTALDRSAGTVTLGGNWTAGIAAAAAGDYILQDGDSNAKAKGLAAWLPYTAPTSGDSFFGVDRSKDVTRLAGLRGDYTGAPIEEALIDLAAKISREGGTPSHAIMSFENYAQLEKALGSKVIYMDNKSEDASVSFKGIMIHGPRGPIAVMPDQNCPSNYFYMLQLDTWKLYSLGAAPKLLKADGLDFLRVSSADAVEVRVGAYFNIATSAPGFNGVGKLA